MQATEYPWDGKVRITIEAAPTNPISIRLRIPGWLTEPASLAVNGTRTDAVTTPGSYTSIDRTWQVGDVVELELPMPVQIIEAHPLLEEARQQVAVRRGPVVYCLEAADLPEHAFIDDITLRLDRAFRVEHRPELLGGIAVIHAPAWHAPSPNWQSQLYRPWKPSAAAERTVQMIPYFAWRNRGEGAMSVWLAGR